jgi:Tol biopolymer transport system component
VDPALPVEDSAIVNSMGLFRGAIVVVVAGCRINFDPLPAADACPFSAFSAPVELAVLDSPKAETRPWLSNDRSEIWFSSNRSGPYQIYHSQRATGAPFDPPVLVDLGLGGGDDPFITADGLTLWFGYSPTALPTDNQLYYATRASASDAFGSATIATELNSAYGQSTPSLTADGLTVIFTSSRAGDPGRGDLYIATRKVTSAPFDPPSLIAELSTVNAECCPSIAADGSSLVYVSDVLTPGQRRIVFSPRVGGMFQPPTFLDPGLSAATGVENDPSLTYDGTAITFGSDRSGGTGMDDIYFAERRCLP